MPVEAPSWLNPGDTSWQITAATLVGLMSVPGLAVLYGGVMQKRWSINSMMLAFAAFAVVLVVWVLWVFKMGFGTPWHGLSHHGFFGNFIGKPGPVLSHTQLQHQSNIPLISSQAFPKSALVYFQFVFAAITPILMLGSVLGRVNFKAWIPFVALWATVVYAVDAFLIWGGGFFAQHGAVDFSGGYVIHLSAGVGGFVAAAVIGPRLQRDREVDAPNLIWVAWDYLTGRKPGLISGVNGMITGLVAITPAAGYVNGWGAMAIGVIGSTIVYFALNYLSRARPFRKVDDTLGVVYTHGFAGFAGGLLVGIFADPQMAIGYKTGSHGHLIATGGVAGVVHGNWTLLKWQLFAALFVIGWTGLCTFLLLKLVGLFVPLRMREENMEIGDVAEHGHEVYPSDVPSLGFPSGVPGLAPGASQAAPAAPSTA